MRSIIEELYYGNINPSNLCCSDAERKFVDIAASQQKCCGAVFSYRGYCGILWCFFGNCSYILSDATLYKNIQEQSEVQYLIVFSPTTFCEEVVYMVMRTSLKSKTQREVKT